MPQAWTKLLSALHRTHCQSGTLKLDAGSEQPAVSQTKFGDVSNRRVPHSLPLFPPSRPVPVRVVRTRALKVVLLLEAHDLSQQDGHDAQEEAEPNPHFAERGGDHGLQGVAHNTSITNNNGARSAMAFKTREAVSGAALMWHSSGRPGASSSNQLGESWNRSGRCLRCQSAGDGAAAAMDPYRWIRRPAKP